MKRAYLLPAAYLLDSVAGDPEWFPHPVRLFGMCITHAEHKLRRPADSSVSQLLKGSLLTAGLAVSSYLATDFLIRRAHAGSEFLGASAEILLAWTCLAARNLQQEGQTVCEALGRQDLPLARRRLSRIVGRDTDLLNASEISRALIETLAESASDGIIAPLFYLTLGGVPLAMAYKAINTLDSMIGHLDARYFYFGKMAARLDDAANLIPSRLTALLIAGASASIPHADARNAWNTWRRDGDKHKSPNAGQPEAAMAGALGVKLGGDNRYDGQLVAAAAMGSEFPTSAPAHAILALRLTVRVALIGLCVAITYVMVRGPRRT